MPAGFPQFVDENSEVDVATIRSRRQFWPVLTLGLAALSEARTARVLNRGVTGRKIVYIHAPNIG